MRTDAERPGLLNAERSRFHSLTRRANVVRTNVQPARDRGQRLRGALRARIYEDLAVLPVSHRTAGLKSLVTGVGCHKSLAENQRRILEAGIDIAIRPFVGSLAHWQTTVLLFGEVGFGPFEFSDLGWARILSRGPSPDSKDELRKMLETEGKRIWNVYIGRSVSKRIVVDHIGRYIRKPPIAQRRRRRVNDEEIEYLAKDTRQKRFSPVRYSNKALVTMLIPHVLDRYRNSMGYFGLLAPRARKMLSLVFLLLRQKRQPRPLPLSWAQLTYKTFGTDPSIDSRGDQMVRVGRLDPANA
jgi:hypothetical protein